jgi:ribosome-binding factor A
MAILTQVRDPRVQRVTVTSVEMDPDMRAATVHVSVMGSQSLQELAIRGLTSSAGFLQACVAERIETRYIPKLKFALDGGVKKSLEIARMLDAVLPSAATEAAAAEAAGKAMAGAGMPPDPGTAGAEAASERAGDRGRDRTAQGQDPKEKA